jgi:uncharacterized protein (DUF1810 family)
MASSIRSYLLSFPERVVRSVLGLGAGLAREVGQVALPGGVRRSQLYQNLVDATLRYLTEKVGGVEIVRGAGSDIPDDFVARRAAGNAVEVLGVVAFRASPVWVLAALADLAGLGRHLIPEIAVSLKARGLLEESAEFTTVDQILDGLERTSGRLASTINAPPLDVAALREEWRALKEDARGLKPDRLPSPGTIRELWSQLQAESERQGRSVFETSSLLAVSAARALPKGVLRLGASAGVGAARSGQVLGAALLDDYRRTLAELREVGYASYARRQLAPYVRAAVSQFSPGRSTLTERILDRIRLRRSAPEDGREGNGYDLDRFLEAQEDVYEEALRELRAGRKVSHWMWFIFPQFDGLGMSETSRRYAIGSLDEARAYLRHPVLGARLTECTEAVNDLDGFTALQIFGTPDDRKFRSSMTLFELVSGPESPFASALDKYFSGERDARTIELVRRAAESDR